MPATDVDFEREFEELVRDLRALPTAAPEQLREHVRLLGEPARARTLRDVLPALSWRRSLLVLAPVCVLGLVSAALIHGLVNSGGSQNQALVQQTSGSGGAADTKGSKLELGTSADPGCPLVGDPGTGPLPGLPGVADRAREGRRHVARPHCGSDADRALIRRLRRIGRRVHERRRRSVRSGRFASRLRASRMRTSAWRSSGR